jgi:hypothetical protein
MSLFESASLVVTPNGTKASKLYAIKPTDGSGDLTVTRATTATRINASGLISSVAANVPRLDYTNSTCPSILVEGQRTNLILNSETLATQSVTVTAQSYTLSFYGSGTVALSGTHTATVVGLGTTRKTYTFTPTAGTLTLTITGTCTKAQLEAGSYATSYIPTTSASVTRNADVINKTGISSLIGQTEGSIFADVNIKRIGIPTRTFTSLTNGTANFINLSFLNTNVLRVTIRANAGTQYNVSTSALPIGRYKLAATYKAGELKLYVNGVLIGTNTNASVSWSAALDRLNLDNSVLATDNFSDDINLVSHWKTALTGEECINLTTI